MSGFQRNQFYTFRATNKIHIGKYEMDILENDEFDYDGFSVRYAGVEYAVPQLRGLLGDWYVPVADTTTTYKSKPAGVEVSHATPEARDRGDSFTMDKASEEEAVVGTLGEQTEIRKAANAGQTDRLEALREQRRQRKASIGINVGADSNPNAPPPMNADDVDLDVEAVLMEHPERTYIQARPVHQSGAAAEKINPSDQAAVAAATERNIAAIRKRAAELETLDPHKSRAEMGGTRHDFASEGGRAVGKKGKYTLIQDDSDGVSVKEYKFSNGAAVGADGVGGNMLGTDVTRVSGRQPVQVGNPVATTPQNRHAGAQFIPDPATTHEPQAVRARQTTQVQRSGNVGIDEILPGGGTGDVDEAMYGDDLETLLPGAAVAGSIRQKMPPAPVMSEADEIAEITDNWSTKRNWQKRVEEAVDFYGDWPEALDAICAKESPKVAAQIRSRLDNPEA